MLEPASRRQFLQQTSLGLAAAASFEMSRASADSPHEKIVVGLIGCGGRGVHDANLFKNVPNVEVAYVSDVDDGRRQAAAKSLGVAANRAVSDLRRILEDKSVDAVIVATPDHWH